jgi:hypothetical protein
MDSLTGADPRAVGEFRLLATPVVANGFVFAGSYDDTLYAVPV